MPKIHGITIQLAVKTPDGTDAFNRTTYTETLVSVDNVLVGQPSATDVTNALQLYGKKVTYMLGIPKGDTHEWEDARVVLPAPFAGTYRTVGYCEAGIEDLVPLEWNKKIMVERYG